MSADTHGRHDHSKQYWKVYKILLVLFLISFVGPFIAETIEQPLLRKILMLTTAFVIAFIKAYYVIVHFMHLNAEKKYVVYMLTTMVVLMLLFFSAVAPDVMKHDGQRWENLAAKQEVNRALEEQKKAAALKAGKEAK